MSVLEEAHRDVELVGLVDAARGYRDARRSPATRDAYARDWARFTSWCADVDAVVLPAASEVVALYAVELAEAGRHPSPRRAGTWRRAGGTCAAVTWWPSTSRTSPAPTTGSWSGAAARRRTRRARAGKLGVPFGSNPATCPVRAVGDWQAAAGIWEGPLWRPVTRHGRLGDRRLGSAAVAQAVKRAAGGVGIDPSRVAGHSLRAGFATSAAAAGATERAIAAQTGHQSLQVLRRYIRDGSLFRDNAATLFGL